MGQRRAVMEAHVRKQLYWGQRWVVTVAPTAPAGTRGVGWGGWRRGCESGREPGYGAGRGAQKWT